MTTEIIVQARCADDTEVKITVSEKGAEDEVITLQNNQDQRSIFVYDDKVVTIKEVKK